MGIEPLGYRTLTGTRRGPLLRFLPISRQGMALVLKRKVFWILLFVALFNFLFRSALIYLVAQVEGQLGMELPRALRGTGNNALVFIGTGQSYRDFITSQNVVVMLMLALASGLLVGNDFRLGAVAFYLSRPITKLDYFLGKFVAVAGMAATITLLPAVVLFIEYGAFSESLEYYMENLHILLAIIAYGSLVCGFSAILLLGLASLLKQTVPVILVLAGISVFLPVGVRVIRQISIQAGQPDPWGWSLLNLWENLDRISDVIFGIDDSLSVAHWPQAALVLGAVSLLSLLIFWKRVSAVEVVR